jgi:sugar lactone lactonase YvrE
MTHEVRLAQAEKAVTGESPVWDDGRGVLWWIDIQGRRLLGWRPEAAIALPALNLPSEIGLVALGSDGCLVLGLEDGLWRYVPETGDLAMLSPVPHEAPNLRLNDGKPDRQGRLWFGSMDKSGSGIPTGALYCWLPDGRLNTIRRGVRVPNAIAVSPDGGTLYFSDSPSQEILAFDLDQESGNVCNERVFAAFTGDDKPDGTAIDAEGGVWVGVVHGARIDRYLPDGRLQRSIPMPVAKPTMAAFGGKRRSTLFVTSQRRFLTEKQLAESPLTGSLLSVDVANQGAAGFRVSI